MLLLLLNILKRLGADYFAVAYTSEGIALREAGITTPILVLHPQPANFDSLIHYKLEPNLYSTAILKGFLATAEHHHQIDFPIHIKFNTGLNRLGFSIEDIDNIVATLKESNALKVASIFSHLAASEDLNEAEFTKQQIANFKAIAAEFKQHWSHSIWLHMCNTSGILNYPEAHFDMVRSGIGLYGFGNSETENAKLKPIASLKSIISQIHHLKAGDTVGYNRAYKSSGPEKTATIPIGHADGLGRQYGQGKGFVSIQGQKAPIVGNVCMDMIMVDVTGIDCKEGDEVIVFDADHSAVQLAQQAQTISYEIITAISQRIKRVIKA